ncbi:S8 family peptidase [Limnobacter sp.]|uniref:S8 family peptidase n=1 Tax=Limnobacter sp. TaxID=2003368 RepID=UPI002FE27DC4
MWLRPFIACALAVSFSSVSSAALSAERWVIQFKPGTIGDAKQLSGKISELARVHKQNFLLIRPFGERGAVVVADSDEPAQVRQRLLSDPAIESVDQDRRIQLRAQSPLIGLLNALDPARQSRSWFHQDLATQPASINTGVMWTNFHGTAPTVVAVLDTGVLPSHPMLQGHLLPGYDFISDPVIAADGQSTGSTDRDSDPSDPGDGVTPADLAADPVCGQLSQSSWHGTFVSSLVAGNPIASEGIFSVNWNAAILPVRVLGKCGGFSSDLADAIRWAAGLGVPGAPANPFPAKVINLSLGAQGACVASIEGAAITAARQVGALVLVSAGNDGSTVDSPANCPGAFGVAAIDQEGLKASYSNFGPGIQLAAPGGDGAFPIWSASNTGTDGPVSNTYSTKVGTSFSAPMVASAASLYWSLNPAASVDMVESLLKSTSRPFLSLNNRPACSADLTNTECNCTQALCGAGMLDVANLVNTQVFGGLTNLFSNTGNVIPPGETRTFSSEGSFNASGQEVSAVSFDVINVIKSSPDVPNPVLALNGLNVDITVPAGVSGFDLRSQVSGGRTAIASVVVANPGATSPTVLASLFSPLVNGTSTGSGVPSATVNDSDSGGAPNSSGGGGGGGALNLFGLWCAAFLLLCFKRIK